MTLLIAVFAALISTIVWYTSSEARLLKTGILCYIFWGASLMWLVDAFCEYAEFGAEYFDMLTQGILNDALLGLSAVALGLIIWLVVLFIKDPKHVIKSA